MAITIVGIPFAAWKYIGWLFVQQQILFEDRIVREAFRGSSEWSAAAGGTRCGSPPSSG